MRLSRLTSVIFRKLTSIGASRSSRKRDAIASAKACVCSRRELWTSLDPGTSMAMERSPNRNSATQSTRLKLTLRPG